MTERKYQAFVSYSHDSDVRLAAPLQPSLSRFAKLWYRFRTMRMLYLFAAHGPVTIAEITIDPHVSLVQEIPTSYNGFA